MERFKKFIRISFFILLIVLASLGVGLSGGVPIPFSNKRRQESEIKIELIKEDKDENKKDTTQVKW
jgi:hypothetical protein